MERKKEHLQDFIRGHHDLKWEWLQGPQETSRILLILCEDLNACIPVVIYFQWVYFNFWWISGCRMFTILSTLSLQNWTSTTAKHCISLNGTWFRSKYLKKKRIPTLQSHNYKVTIMLKIIYAIRGASKAILRSLGSTKEPSSWLIFLQQPIYLNQKDR